MPFIILRLHDAGWAEMPETIFPWKSLAASGTAVFPASVVAPRVRSSLSSRPFACREFAPVDLSEQIPRTQV